jgi:hypothetical protein
MSRGGAVIVAAAALIAAVALAGCGEREQVAVYKQGKYQGKPDSQPWDNDPKSSVYTPAQWNKGDQQGWENALKTRTLTQNEYTRAE